MFQLIRPRMFALILFMALAPFASAAEIVSVLKKALDHELHTSRIQNRRPVAVFDLDETLFHSDRRKVQSYLDAISKNRSEIAARFPTLAPKLLQIDLSQGLNAVYRSQNQYDCFEWLAFLGVRSQAVADYIQERALPIYLSPQYMMLDRAYSGSRQLLHYLYSAGVEVYFVSSRYEHLQLEPTLKRLKLSGLYLNSDQTHVLLRKKGEASIDFKERAFRLIKSRENSGRKIILVAENEPENMNLMTRIFPNAVSVFLLRAQVVSVPLNRHPKMLLLKHYSSNSP